LLKHTLDYRKLKRNPLSFDNRDSIYKVMTYNNRMRLDWIDKQLELRGLTRRALADAIPTLTESKLSLTMKGERKLTAVEADNIRRFFGYRLPDDPPRNIADALQDQLALLGDDQLRTVALYLEALTGNSPTQREEF